MPYQPPVRIRSADDIPAAIAWAGENTKNRWYVARMAKAYDRADLIPDDWDEAAAPGAPRRITSEQANMDSAMIDDAVAVGEVPDQPDGDSGEPITAAIGRKRRTQKIQTEAGVKRYGAPIGTPIIKKDGKLVADLTKSVRLDHQGKVAEAPLPKNKVRSIAIDRIEEGDEIVGKSGRELVVISNKQGEGYHYELKTSDAEGKRFDFTVPATGRIRLIEDDNELDDDDERDTPTPVDPAHVLESKAALKAARSALRRGEKGVTPKTVAAARQKVADAEAQLDAQMKPPNGEKLERADKAPKPKPPTPEEAELPPVAETDWSGKGVDDVVRTGDTLVNNHSKETFRVVKVDRNSTTAISNDHGNQVVIPRHQFVEGDYRLSDTATQPEKPATASDSINPPKPEPDNSPDWSDATDMRGNALVPGAEYRINRRTGKIWTIDSRNDDGTFKLTAADGATGGRNTRSRVEASTLVPVNEPEPEPAPTVEKPPVTDEALAGLRKDSKRQPLKVGKGYKISSRGAVVWEIDSINDDGTLELRPTGDSHGNRRRHSVKPSKMIPVDAAPAPKPDRKSKLADMQAKVDAAPAPEDAAREALQRDLDTMGALHKELFDVEQEMVRARRLNAWGEERAEIQSRIDKAQKNFIMAKMDVKASRRAASTLGIELPDPPDPTLPRIIPPQARVRATPYVPPQAEVREGSSTDPLYYQGLTDAQLWAEQRGANASGNQDALAVIAAEDVRRQEMLDGPTLTNKSETELHDLLDSYAEKGDHGMIEKIMKELDQREENENLANTDDVWERIALRIRNGANPMQAEADETGKDIDAIVRRESLSYLRQHYGLPDGTTYERAVSHGFLYEVAADMRKAEDAVRGGDLLNAEGKRAGIQEIELWTTRSEDRALRYANEELARYWDENGGRITRKTFKERVKTAIGAPGAGSGQYTDGGSAGFLR